MESLKKSSSIENRKFMCKKSTNNINNKPSKFKLNYSTVLPSSFDFSDKLPSPYDQLDLGSCASNAGALAFKFNFPLIDPSRLFLYFNARTRENPNNQFEDCGSSVEDVCMTLKNIGVCSELLWPYNISNFTLKPSEDCYDDASNNRISIGILNPVNLNQDLNTLKTYLSQSKPILFGLLVCDSIMKLTSDNCIYDGTGNILGGHCLTANPFLQRNNTHSICFSIFSSCLTITSSKSFSSVLH